MMRASVGGRCASTLTQCLGKAFRSSRKPLSQPVVPCRMNATTVPSKEEYYTLKGLKRRAIVTLIPGDGVGPEVTEAAVGVLNAVQAPVDFELFSEITDITKNFPVITSIARNQVCLKGGPWFVDREDEHSKNNNVALRQALNLYCNVVPIKSLPGVKTRPIHENIDIVVVRENTEAEYSGLEQEVAPGVVQSLKVVTRAASLRIAEAAFAYAAEHGRKKVAAIHKANIQKLSDGLFLESCRQVAQKYPDIEYREVIIDNTCMQLVMRPQQFDVMVTPNLYGNLVINVASALVGGPGLVGGVNWGLRGESIFEPGTRHVGMDIAGKDKANPVGILLSSVMMLRHLQMFEEASRIETAVRAVLTEGKVRTSDIGGTASTREMTQAIIDKL